jgi:formate-dependent phosphoribosylglycinamide formyltransferase (GAR transformylase)
MSSSGKGHTNYKTVADIETAWNYAVEGLEAVGSEL